MSNDKGSSSGSKSIVDRVLDHPIRHTVSTIDTPHGTARLHVPIEVGRTSLREIITGKKSDD